MFDVCQKTAYRILNFTAQTKSWVLLKKNQYDQLGERASTATMTHYAEQTFESCSVLRDSHGGGDTK